MSDISEEVTFDGLERLERALKGKLPTIKVGIMGADSARSGGGSNAEIGARHEFGLGVPQRSFLRMPLNTKFENALEETGLLKEEILKNTIENSSLLEVGKALGTLAEEVVLEAFDSGGYGEWEKWSTGYSNRSGDILVDSQQLRDSISHEVSENE